MEKSIIHHSITPFTSHPKICSLCYKLVHMSDFSSLYQLYLEVLQQLNKKHCCLKIGKSIARTLSFTSKTKGCKCKTLSALHLIRTKAFRVKAKTKEDTANECLRINGRTGFNVISNSKLVARNSSDSLISITMLTFEKTKN